MSAETRNNGVNDDANKHESPPLTEENPGPGFLEKRSVHIVLGLLLFVALSLVILSVDDESDSVVLAPDSTEQRPLPCQSHPLDHRNFPPRFWKTFALPRPPVWKYSQNPYCRLLLLSKVLTSAVMKNRHRRKRCWRLTLMTFLLGKPWPGT